MDTNSYQHCIKSPLNVDIGYRSGRPMSTFQCSIKTAERSGAHEIKYYAPSPTTTV